MEQNIHELKKDIDQPFQPQLEMIKSVVHDACAILIENFKEFYS